MCSERNNDNRKRGRLIILSGFSGAGKGTLVSKLMEEYPEEYALSVSVTTRQPRKGEIPGKTYHYRSQDEFDELVKENGFIEYAGYAGNSYGTPRAFVEDNMKAGKNVLLEIEFQGALIVKKQYPDVKMIFITTKDAATLENRLRGRNSETEESIKKRLTQAVKEAASIKEYNDVIINDDLNTACEELKKACDGSSSVISDDKLDIIEQIRKDLIEKLGNKL